jgi:hypothetical protein
MEEKLEILAFETDKGRFLLSRNRWNFCCYVDEMLALDRDFDVYDNMIRS